MENKPIVTCHGDQTLFAKLHPGIIQGLPREPVEWRRSYGRPPRTIYVESTFVPYNPDIVPGDEDWTLLGRPFFHTFWADCDIDLYKTSVKEEIAEWISDLRTKNITDWLIIVVVNEESKVKTKILRTSVFDKIRSDFCNKQTDRCTVLMEPFKPDLRSGESWGSLLARMRQLLLQSYNKHLGKFEDFMRAQRERRTETGWNFCQYFMLQEELAFMFEMLGLYEDSLVQYDELDALFTQFVLNHAAGDRADWLTNFHKIQCSSWDGLCLSQPINIEKRQLIKRNRPSLLDFRNYLFSRQCTLLFLLLRPWEVAQRSIPFMHNCMKELDILQISLPPGAIACWIFLSCLEVLRTCEKFSEAGHMEAHSLYTANLREYARKKLYSLGTKCGLLPEMETLLEHNQTAELLLEGSITPAQREIGNSEPLEKLKEAMSSKPSFQKHYLELSELAMGTYKHIGRIRSARLIGKDLATFYMKLGQPQNAEGFLMDALKTYKQEGWEMLADHTRLDLAECHRVLANHAKYVKTCVHIAASPVLNEEKRRFHQKGMVELVHTQLKEPEYVRCRPIYLLQEASPTQETFVLNTECSVKLTLDVNLLEPIHCDAISLSLICQPLSGSSVDQSDGGKLSTRRTSQSGRRTRHESTSSTSGINFYNHVTHVTKLAPSVIEMQTYYERRSADRSVTACGLQSKASLRRTDSGSSTHQMVETEIQKEDFGICLEVKDVELKPGENTVVLTGKPPEKGQYLLSQLCIQVGQLQFLKSVTSLAVSFGVVRDLPSLHIQPTSGHFYTGIPQEAMLTFHSGSYAFDDDLPVTLSLPEGLAISGEAVKEDHTIDLSPARPYQSQEYKLNVFAEPDDECETIKHKVMLECTALEHPAQCLLEFKSSLNISQKVHTCSRKKYIQLLVQSRQGLVFDLSEHTLTLDSRDVELLPMNKTEQKMTVDGECTASYMWQLKCNIPESPPLHCTFCLAYRQCNTESDAKTRKWTYPFTVTDYKTLYTVKSEVTPPQGQDSCTAGALCRLALKVRCLDSITAADAASLMYQILPDDSNWALSGKTSGVFKMEDKLFQTSLYVMPLLGGHLPVPRAKLVKYHVPSALDETTEIEGTETSKDETKTEPQTQEKVMPELVAFSPAQVYNVSLGTQVHVLPAVNTSHVDITVAE